MPCSLSDVLISWTDLFRFILLPATFTMLRACYSVPRLVRLLCRGERCAELAQLREPRLPRELARFGRTPRTERNGERGDHVQEPGPERHRIIECEGRGVAHPGTLQRHQVQSRAFPVASSPA